MAKARARTIDDSGLPKVIEENIERVSDAVSRLRHDAQRLQKRLVLRGRRAEREVTRQINKLVRDLRKNGVAGRIESARKDVEKAVQQGVKQVFRALNVPQRKEVEALSRKVSALEKQVGSLRRSARREARERPPVAGV